MTDSVHRIEYNDGTTRCIIPGNGRYLLYHCHDGPAIYGGPAKPEFWWRNRYCTLDKWLELNDQLTSEEKVMLKLQYG